MGHFSVSFLKKTLIFISVLILLLSDVGSSFAAAPYEKHTLFLEVSYKKNLLFNKYDIAVFVDDTQVDTISQGTSIKRSIDLDEGTHRIYFYKLGNTDVQYFYSIFVPCDLAFSCTLESESKKIIASGISVKDGLSQNALPFPDLTYMILDDAIEKLKILNYININYETESVSVKNMSDLIVISQNIEPGQEVNKKQKINLIAQSNSSFIRSKLQGKTIAEIERISGC